MELLPIKLRWFKTGKSQNLVHQTRSPDLNPCDYYLWGYLKARVYNPLPETLGELKANIEREIKKINNETLKNFS